MPTALRALTVSILCSLVATVSVTTTGPGTAWTIAFWAWWSVLAAVTVRLIGESRA
ncbi:hypothetical protein [Streptomyces avicenniae]|uniref:hypothetical protein n=1 Tax=Streptomyces avicenniae TaxID=500153 RepID=UPI000AD735D4|nr:hypothetical protein [Streptomyces avicenniae]